jgi:O-antigen/teichoic acid export membrane protein
VLNPPATEPPDDARSTADLAEAVVAGSRWIVGARVMAEGLLLVTMVVLARLIPPAEFGRFAIVLFMQELAVGLVGGFGNALVQRPAIRREHLQAALAIVLLVEGALIALTIGVLGPLLITPVFGAQTDELVVLATPIWILAALSAIPQALLQRRLAFPRIAQIQLLSLFTGAAASLALAVVLHLDAEALVLGALAAGVVGTALSLASAPVPLPRLRRAEVRDLGVYGVPASLASISWAGFRNADYAIVGARLGATSAGIYWRAFQLAVEYQKKISVIMQQVAFPLLSRTGSHEDMFLLRLRIVRLLTVAVFPLLAGLVVLAPVVIPWVFGPTWESAVVPTQVLTVAGAATLVIDAVGATLMAAGRARALLAYGWAHFAVYAGVVALVAGRGIVAVSIAAAGVHLLFLGVAYVVLLHGLVDRPLRSMWHDVGPAVVSSLALLAVAAPVNSALGATAIPVAPHVLAVAAVGAPAYLLTLRLAFPAAWRDLIAMALGLLPPRLRRGKAAPVPAPAPPARSAPPAVAEPSSVA